jgi:hypothetical protein
MTDIILIKTLPTSTMYSGSGVTIIHLKNFENMVINSKKSIIKIRQLKAKNSANADNTDQLANYVTDLKNVDQTIHVTGWLEDGPVGNVTNDTAWNKFWKLVAMQTRGGPLTLLTIGDGAPPYGCLNFPSGSPPRYKITTPQAFIENVTGNISADDTGDILTIHPAKPARIKVDLDIYLGYER